jgi:hypothetical protein
MLQCLRMVNHIPFTGAARLACRRARMSFAEFILGLRASLDLPLAVTLARITVGLGMVRVRASRRAVPAVSVAASGKREN